MPSWTTLDLPIKEQFGYWREVLCEAFITLNPTRKRAGGFSGSVKADMISEINVTSLLTEEHRVVRGAAEIAKSPLEVYFVNMQMKGTVLAKQRGREVLIEPNEFYIVDSTEPYDLDYHSRLKIYSFRIPKRLLDPLLTDPAELTARRISRDTPMGALAVDFLQSIQRQPDAVPAPTGRSVARVMTELVACALQGTADVQDRAAGSVRHALLGSILSFIDANLHDPNLSVETVCRRFKISPRYLHRLFESAETTFSASIRSRRLERTAAELARTPRRTVSDIALDCGFSDISHFNRSFRKRFGASPREYRHLPAR